MLIRVWGQKFGRECKHQGKKERKKEKDTNRTPKSERERGAVA